MGSDIQLDPRTGKLTAHGDTPGAVNSAACERDRMNLAQIDDDREFREILDEANRANASFYPMTHAVWWYSTRRSCRSMVRR